MSSRRRAWMWIVALIAASAGTVSCGGGSSAPHCSTTANNAVPVTGVTLNQTDWVNVHRCETSPGVFHACYQLVATVTPDDATNKKVLWSVSDRSAATVTADGLVTMRKPEGQPSVPLTVTATTEDGCFTAEVTGSASCPMVYAGDGAGGFNYLTDLQGPIIGFPLTYPMARRTALFGHDQVILDGLKPDGSGSYQLKVRETQSEIAYLDDVRLIAVDVPDGYELASSSAEQTYGNGYVNPHRFFTLGKSKELRSATDWQGRDVTAQLRSTDGKPAPIDGADSPSYTLDFGDVDAAHAKLVIRAWALYSPTYGKALEKPSVSVKNAAGEWTEVKTFGLPAGDEKTMVYDLSGLFQGKDRKVKLALGTRPWVRWVVDSVKLDDSAPVEPVVGPELKPSSATLAQGGLVTMELPTVLSRGFVRDDHRPFNGVGMGTGRFTRYGDVGELVAKADDKFVIMGMGDEVKLTFAGAPPPKAGYHRVMVMKVMQFYKAPYVDLNVEPLPFRGMSSYPYPATEHYPDDAEHQAYLAKYNTRVQGPAVAKR